MNKCKTETLSSRFPIHRYTYKQESFRVQFFSEWIRLENTTEFPLSILWLFFLIEILPLLRDMYYLYFYIEDDLLSKLLCPHLFTLLPFVWILWINDHFKRTLSYWQISSCGKRFVTVLIIWDAERGDHAERFSRAYLRFA